MNRQRNQTPQLHPTIENLSQAIFIVNRHAKTAPDPKFLYRLKHDALQKLLKEGKAKKIGLHFSNNPRFSQQQSDVLVKCGKYSFHLPPSKSDFKQLPHLGKLDHNVRNPKAHISLGEAKKLLTAYTGVKQEQTGTPQRRRYQKPVFKRLGEDYF